MELKFDNSKEQLFVYFDKLFEQYLNQKQRQKVDCFFAKLRYEEEIEFLRVNLLKYPEHVPLLWFGAYLGKLFHENKVLIRNSVRQCPFLFYLLHLASYDVLEHGGIEEPYLDAQEEIDVYRYRAEHDWYDLMKNKGNLESFFSGTGFQFLWIGDERNRKPCGVAIFPSQEDLLQYSIWNMDRLVDGTICFKDDFFPTFVENMKETNRYWITINPCQLSISEELLLKKYKSQIEEEMKQILGVDWKNASKWQILERFYQLEELHLLSHMI